MKMSSACRRTVGSAELCCQMCVDSTSVDVVPRIMQGQATGMHVDIDENVSRLAVRCRACRPFQTERNDRMLATKDSPAVAKAAPGPPAETADPALSSDLNRVPAAVAAPSPASKQASP